MYERFTDRARKVMQLANQEAQRFNHEYIGTEHILLGLVQEGAGVAAHVLTNLEITLLKVRQEVEKIIQASPKTPDQRKLPKTPRAKKVIDYAIEEARNLNHNYVGTEHLLLGLIREQEGVASQVLLHLGLNLEVARKEILKLLGHTIDPAASRGRPATGKPAALTPALDSVGRDLTESARERLLPPLVGREREMERMLQVLLCRDSPNPLLVGEPGVGKKAIVEGLAQRLAAGNVPDFRADSRIVALDLPRLLGHTKDPGHYQRLLRVIWNEIRRAKNLILFLEHMDFLDELAGDPRWMLLAHTTLPSVLERGECRCIALATPTKFRQLSSAGVLESCFRPIFVQPLSAEETLAVLRGRQETYAAHHGVQITEGALQAAVDLSDHHLRESYFPGKAIRLLDEACALVRLRSPRLPPTIGELEARREELTRQKEEAVAEQDFDTARQLSKQALALTQERDRLWQEWSTKRKESLIVDAEAIAEVIRQLPAQPSF
jgi:ATP-dependent Clp protease ATP-binding subunit ClpC